MAYHLGQNGEWVRNAEYPQRYLIVLNVNQLLLSLYQPVLEPTTEELHGKTIIIKLLK